MTNRLGEDWEDIPLDTQPRDTGQVWREAETHAHETSAASHAGSYSKAVSALWGAKLLDRSGVLGTTIGMKRSCQNRVFPTC